ncbi:MAG: hypothetical protein ACYS9X_11220 [Planctomycetota bacterium]|jgi:hypothetical protein
MGGRELPRGIEVLVKKAAVDAAFKTLLLEKRAGAAGEIGLDLDAAEVAMLMAIPAAQLEAIIASTKVDEKVRPAFLGRAAALMIAALGVSGASCGVMMPKTRGIDPDRPTRSRPEKDAEEKTEADDGDE